jgi:hypothetical protein
MEIAEVLSDALPDGPNGTVNSAHVLRAIVRTIVRSSYDLQKLRIQIGNRLSGNFKIKLGQLPGEKEDTLDAESKGMLGAIRFLHKRLTDGVVAGIKKAVRAEAAEVEEEETEIPPEEEEEKLTEAEKNSPEQLAKLSKAKAQKKLDELVTKVVSRQYNIMTEKRKKFPKPKDFVGNAVISDYTELCLVAQYMEIEKSETTQFNRLEDVLEAFPIWTEFLSKIPGMGKQMAGVIISEINIFDSPARDEEGKPILNPDGSPKMLTRYPSSLWRYCGLDVAEDGRGRSRRKEHLVQKAYINKDGKKDERASITFNPFLKTKMVGVFGTNVLRCKKCPYRAIYDAYKHRMEHHAVHGVHNDKTPDPKFPKTKIMLASKGHRHQMAIRYAVKMFLLDLYKKWRELEGLPVPTPYREGKLGYPPHREAVKPEVEVKAKERPQGEKAA